MNIFDEEQRIERWDFIHKTFMFILNLSAGYSPIISRVHPIGTLRNSRLATGGTINSGHIDMKYFNCFRHGWRLMRFWGHVTHSPTSAPPSFTDFFLTICIVSCISSTFWCHQLWVESTCGEQQYETSPVSNLWNYKLDFYDPTW